MILKHDIPILEFDDDKRSILMPNHENLGIRLPEKAIFPFLGESIDSYVKNNDGKVVAEFFTITKNFLVYVIQHKGEDICVCEAPVGSAPASKLMDFLISYGVKKIISAGSCGTLIHIPENTFIIPTKALRDEGTSYHYLPPSRYVDMDKPALEAIEKILSEHGLAYTEVVTWTTDGFFRETKELVKYRVEEGCSVVEMECSALAACGKMREAIFGMILFTADTLHELDTYNERNWGKDSHQKAIELCLDTVIKL